MLYLLQDASDWTDVLAFVFLPIVAPIYLFFAWVGDFLSDKISFRRKMNWNKEPHLTVKFKIGSLMFATVDPQDSDKWSVDPLYTFSGIVIRHNKLIGVVKKVN